MLPRMLLTMIRWNDEAGDLLGNLRPQREACDCCTRIVRIRQEILCEKFQRSLDPA